MVTATKDKSLEGEEHLTESFKLTDVISIIFTW